MALKKSPAVEYLEQDTEDDWRYYRFTRNVAHQDEGRYLPGKKSRRFYKIYVKVRHTRMACNTCVCHELVSHIYLVTIHKGVSRHFPCMFWAPHNFVDQFYGFFNEYPPWDAHPPLFTQHSFNRSLVDVQLHVHKQTQVEKILNHLMGFPLQQVMAHVQIVQLGPRLYPLFGKTMRSPDL